MAGINFTDEREYQPKLTFKNNDAIHNVSTRIFKYIEIKTWEDGGVVKRLDVSSKSERQIEKIDSGMNRNLNHDQYYTCDYESEVKLDTI